MKMKVVSLFAGVGGFDLGFERAGFETVAQVEIDPKCREVLARHFPKAQRFNDVREFKYTDPIDVVCGGFPCQDLSVAGKRKGLAGERSGLWWEFHRILGESRPKYAVLENVPGLLSSNKGADMEAVVRSLVELGYRVCWRVLDSQYFGVAQRRRRVFIVGSLGDGRSAEVLFEPESLCRDTPPRPEKREGSTGGVAASIGVRMRGLDDSCADNLQVAGTLGAGDGNRGWRNDLDQGAFIPTEVYDARGNGEGDLCPAITGDHQNRITDYTGIAIQLGVRRLTPTECERLQGFPDGWTEGFSDSARYKMMGNAVTVSVARYLANRIKEATKQDTYNGGA